MFAFCHVKFSSIFKSIVTVSCIKRFYSYFLPSKRQPTRVPGVHYYGYLHHGKLRADCLMQCRNTYEYRIRLIMYKAVRDQKSWLGTQAGKKCLQFCSQMKGLPVCSTHLVCSQHGTGGWWPCPPQRHHLILTRLERVP